MLLAVAAVAVAIYFFVARRKKTSRHKARATWAPEMTKVPVAMEAETTKAPVHMLSDDQVQGILDYYKPIVDGMLADVKVAEAKQQRLCKPGTGELLFMINYGLTAVSGRASPAGKQMIEDFRQLQKLSPGGKVYDLTLSARAWCA